MSFAWPIVLCLLVVPVALLSWEGARRRRAAETGHPKIARGEAGLASLKLTDPNVSGAAARKTRGTRVWLAAGLTLAVIALARPQWGRLDEPVFEQAREILIAVDLSRSMLTPDVAPSRLDRAKLLIQSLLEKLAGERVGLEVFSGTAFLQAPLSADYEILREFLPSLGPDFLPVGGTDYAALIDTAAGSFTGAGGADRFLVVLSDGGATDQDWQGHLEKLKEKGVRVIALGIGTENGGFIPDGSGGFQKDEDGAVVKVKLEADALKEMAEKTGGVYRDASQWVDLPGLVASTVEAGKKGRFVDENTMRYAERFQWFLAPGLLCLLVSFWREFPVRPKPRPMKLSKTAPSGTEVPAGGSPARAAQGNAQSLVAAAVLLIAAIPCPAAETDSQRADALLGRIVGRISAEDAPQALDWAEMGRQTLEWGHNLQAQHGDVPAGPVNDALAAVVSGSSMDASAADWPKMRSDLEALLKKQDQKQEKNQQQSKDNPQQQQKKQESSQEQQQKQGESAFGNMKDQPPPPPQDSSQKVGGTPDKKQRDPSDANPALAGKLEKLDEVRNQDSPAELFRMIENQEPRPEKKKGKDW